MTKKEDKFCCYYASNGNARISAVMAGYTANPEQLGQQLLMRDDVLDKVKKYRNTRFEDLRFMALLGYERLAFGSIADCIQLLYMDKPDLQTLEAMDLYMISEIKRPKDGAMEIKFFDRLKALEKLSEAQQASGENSIPFYKALENSAEILNNYEVYEDDTN
ncbi:MAG: terminase small subunit [Acutalibacteraceae bacterium]|nr:terminase small subunit [Acutalibacteraceae bacterium]